MRDNEVYNRRPISDHFERESVVNNMDNWIG